MTCTYREQLEIARDQVAVKIAEATRCNNTKHVQELAKQATAIQELLKRVVDDTGDDRMAFDVTSRAVC